MVMMVQFIFNEGFNVLVPPELSAQQLPTEFVGCLFLTLLLWVRQKFNVVIQSVPSSTLANIVHKHAEWFVLIGVP